MLACNIIIFTILSFISLKVSFCAFVHMKDTMDRTREILDKLVSIRTSRFHLPIELDFAINGQCFPV